MKDRIHELLQRNLQEVFGEGDATRRRAAIEELYTEDCVLVRFPGPIHSGNGRCIVYIDERANEQQRKALAQIGTGKAGPGGPFELFSTRYGERRACSLDPTLSSEMQRAEGFNWESWLTSRLARFSATSIRAKRISD